jgi:hypothetical protein
MYVVQLMVDNQEDKLAFLKLICRHVANTRCRPDPEELMAKMAATELGLDSSDLSVTSFSKAISSFNKTKQKVGRAFSFNKTPSKMKRAVSSMMSPRLLVTESATLGRTPGFTPHQGLRELRLEDTPRSSRKGLQSCVNLGDEGGFGSPSRGSFPRRQTKELGQVQESPGAENQNPDFRTPNLCSRPSFRDKLGFRQRAGSLAGFGSKKHQIN